MNDAIKNNHKNNHIHDIDHHHNDNQLWYDSWVTSLWLASLVCLF